jgi:hypothetical protein
MVGDQLSKVNTKCNPSRGRVENVYNFAGGPREQPIDFVLVVSLHSIIIFGVEDLLLLKDE